MQSKNWKYQDKKHNTFWIKLDIGGRYKGASIAPDGLLLHSLNNNITNIRQLIKPTAILDFTELNLINFDKNNYINIFDSIIKTVVDNTENDKLNLYISGDHFCAAPLIIASRQTTTEDIAVIWIDAHADLHTPETSYSGNPHGMPLALLLGLKSQKQWWNSLQNNYKLPVIKPENTIIIGLRSYEHKEIDHIRQLGIKVFSVEDIRELSPTNFVNNLIKPLLQNKITYISFDIDVLDADLVPGTGTPVKNGLSLNNAKKLLQTLFSSLNIKFLEITEFNPLFDIEQRTAKNVCELLATIHETIYSTD